MFILNLEMKFIGARYFVKWHLNVREIVLMENCPLNVLITFGLTKRNKIFDKPLAPTLTTSLGLSRMPFFTGGPFYLLSMLQLDSYFVSGGLP